MPDNNIPEAKRPQPRRNTILLIIIIVLILGAGGVYWWEKTQVPSTGGNNPQDQNSNQQQNTNPPVNTEGQFENAKMKITIPSGWSYEEATTGGVNITKGNYILYINPDITQASGVEGGRFAEIAQGSPSADAVINYWPTEPCGSSVKQNITDRFIRTDFFVSKANAGNRQDCNVPSDDRTVWYFSYVTTPNNGYFGDPSKVNSNIDTRSGLRQFVISMSYQANNVNSLPNQNDTQNKDMLNQMSEIIKTLQFK